MNDPDDEMIACSMDWTPESFFRRLKAQQDIDDASYGALIEGFETHPHLSWKEGTC